MIRTLSLDAGGVLVRPNWRKVAALFSAEGIAVPPEELARQELAVMREIDTARSVRRSSDGERTARFLARVFERTGRPADPSVVRAAIEAACRVHAAENLWDDVPDDVAPALERLRGLGLTLVVLSNANGTVREKLARLGLLRWFEAVVDSGEEGVEKPDPRFFARGLARVRAETATTLHVGDLYHVDVVGAWGAGLRAALIDRGGLQVDRDCPRFPDLSALAAALQDGDLDAELGRPAAR